MVFAEHGYVEHIASAAHEVFIGGMDGNGQPGSRDSGEDVFRESRLARSRDGTVYEDSFHNACRYYIKKRCYVTDGVVK